MSDERIKAPEGDRRARGTSGQIKQRRGITLGFKIFEKATAVEGMTISRTMKRDIMAASAEPMSPAARSDFIMSRYGKKT